MKRLHRLAAAGLAGMLLAGCVTTTVEGKKGLGFGEKPAGYKFEKVRNAMLELTFSGPKILKAGQPGEIIFILKNVGGNNVRLEEWRMNEPDNLRLFCQVWLPGQEKPDPDRWLQLDGPVRQPERRYNLELMPERQVMIHRQLEFLKDLVITSGRERRFFIRAELNLTSVRCSSPVAAISVQSDN